MEGDDLTLQARQLVAVTFFGQRLCKGFFQIGSGTAKHDVGEAFERTFELLR